MIPGRKRSIHEKFALTHYNCADGSCFIMHIWIAIVFDMRMHRISASGNHWLIDWLIDWIVVERPGGYFIWIQDKLEIYEPILRMGMANGLENLPTTEKEDCNA